MTTGEVMHSHFRILIAFLATGALLGVGAIPASATSEPREDQVADLIAELAPVDVAAPVRGAHGDAVVVDGDQSVSIPKEGARDVLVDLGSGLTIPLGLPAEAADSAAAVADDGTVVYQATASVDVAVQAIGSAVRLMTVLRDSSAPTEYAYTVGDYEPRAKADGSITLTVTTAEFTAEIGRFEPPWAVDSAGTPVPTRYLVRGSTIIQEVDHESGQYAYPLVADPQYGYGRYFYIFFNRAETATIATMGWGATVLTAACGFAGMAVAGPAGAAAGVIACGIVAGSIVYQAGVAQNSSPKRCLRLAFPWAIPVQAPSPATYRDGRCT